MISDALPLAFFSMPGGLEWIVIGLVALLLFGKRLPGVARSLGQALHEFKSGFGGGMDGDQMSSAGKPDSESVTKSEAAPPPAGKE